MSRTALYADGDQGGHVPGYQILDEIDQGWLAPVYRARQESLDRIVVLHSAAPAAPRVCHRDAERVRLRIVGAILGRLRHPNIVQVYDRFEHAGRAYLVLEYVGGGSLADLWRAEPLPYAAAAALMEHVARALAYVHRAGVVHRGLTPRNILLAAPPLEADAQVTDTGCERVLGFPKLSGFDLAKDAKIPESALEPGIIVGTPVFMAPEQAAGREDSIGPATDVFAAGIVLYRILTGRTPWEEQGDDAFRLLQQIIAGCVIPPRKRNPKIPRALEGICLKCLEQDPARRDDARTLAANLRGFVNRFTKRTWF